MGGGGFARILDGAGDGGIQLWAHERGGIGTQVLAALHGGLQPGIRVLVEPLRLGALDAGEPGILRGLVEQGEDAIDALELQILRRGVGGWNARYSVGRSQRWDSGCGSGVGLLSLPHPTSRARASAPTIPTDCIRFIAPLRWMGGSLRPN